MYPIAPIPHASVPNARVEGTIAESAVPADVAAEIERWDVKQWFFDLLFGVAALVVGIAGLVLPVLPGWIAIFAGVIVLAGRIPMLRRGLTRLVMTDGCQSVLDRLATNRATRRLMARALMRTEIRRAVDPEARRRVVNAVVGGVRRDDAGQP